MSDQNRASGKTFTGNSSPSGGRATTASPENAEERLKQAQQEFAEESEVDETTPAGAYPLGKAMTGGLVNDGLPDGGTDDITG